jgi:hypothetical protein
MTAVPPSSRACTILTCSFYYFFKVFTVGALFVYSY